MAHPKFYTIFPTDSTIHLSKDPGMIPYVLHWEYGYDSTYVSFIPNDVCDFNTCNYKGVSLVHVENKKPNENYKLAKGNIINYIVKNAKKIDILNLYFLKHSIIYALVFKLFNPKGIIYIKLDTNAEIMRRIELQKINNFRTFFFRLYLKYIPTLISVETLDAVKHFHKKYKVDYPKLLYVPNGIYHKQINELGVKMRSFKEKENLIISVHSVGTYVKNTEFLLDAIKETNLQDWKVVIIGPIEESFRLKIEQFFFEFPQLKEKVTFTEAIYDKKELFEWYNRAKVFCLTSRWESFGLVFVEAQYFGNYIVSTPLDGANDITNKKFGCVVNNENELANTFTKLIDNQSYMEEIFPEAIEHVKFFYWENILKNLDNEIQKNLKKIN
jgi:glycosyltransferase involved in cell wall biosynthesis